MLWPVRSHIRGAEIGRIEREKLNDTVGDNVYDGCATSEKVTPTLDVPPTLGDLKGLTHLSIGFELR